jgi:hypothetical protein
VDWRTHGPPLSTPEQPRPASRRAYEVLRLGRTGLSEHPIEWYEEQGFEYLIASSFVYRIPLLDDAKNAERERFYASLDKQLQLAQQFRPGEDGREPDFVFDEICGPIVSLWQRERPGPTIRIYELGRS